MKKKSLISLSSLLLASALLVGCGNKTSKQQVESKEEPQVVEPSDDNHQDDNESNSGGRSNGVEKCHIHIDLHGTSLKTGSTKQTDIVTRSGTLWNLLSNLAPAKEDIVIPGTEEEGVTYNIKSIAYSFDEKGEDVITPSDAIRSDTNLFLQIEHEDSETGVEVLWGNDGGEQLDKEKYEVGEIPFYAGPTPKSTQEPSKTFVGWLPAISPIEDGDTQRIYVAQYEKIGVECVVTYDYNYKIDDSEVVDIRYVKQGECAEPLDPKPVRHNYAFDDWYKDQACTTKYTFDEPIVDNLTRIYAKWIPTAEHLVIDPNGGTFTDNTTVVKNIDSHYGATWGEIKTNHTVTIKTAPEGYLLDGYKYEYYDDKTAAWKVIPDDNFKIETNLSIKVTYTQIEATLQFANAYESGATMPENKTIEYGTKWSEIKSSCMPTGTIKDGFKFDHYYIDNGEGVDPTIINDDYVFTTGTVTLNACWDVVVHFNSDTKKGIVPYSIAHLLTGEKWVYVKNKYSPTVVDEDVYQFVNYVTDDSPGVVVDDNYVFTEPVLLTASYSQNEVTLKFVNDYQAQSGGTMPSDKTILYGTKWVDIKNDCKPTGEIVDGFTFDHYYINNGEGVKPTIITDDYVFNTTGELTLHANWELDITFDANEKGTVPYKTTKLLTGTKWGDIAHIYRPTVTDPDIYQFDKYTTNDATPVDVTDTYVFTKPVKLTAQYKGAEADSFATDSWETFTSYVSSHTTFQQMTAPGEAYYEEYMSTEGGKESGTFVGLTRTVNVFGKNYTVRVIDEGNTGSSTAAHGHFFTFEFTNLLDLEIPYSLTMNNNYKNSYINNYLNNTFLYALPTALQNAIKPTNAKYYDASVTEPTQRVKDDLDAKLFILSASELGFTKFPDYDIDVTAEGTYAYYQAGADKKKTLLNQTAYVNYWTRSADVSGTAETAWNVNSTGTLGEEFEGAYYPIEVGSSGVYIAPAFEIR